MTGPGDFDSRAPGTPPVTVVMPTRNQASFIERAIASVFAQGITGLELCVQDGASTDGTPALLQRLAARHPGLRRISEPDNGPADAVNRAVARGRGAVIGWLNSDDLYTPGAVDRALTHLQQHPQHVMVYGEGEHIDAEGTVIGRYPTRDPATPLEAWADGCPICQPTVFLRREAFDALGGLDTQLRTAFDYEFWLRLLKAHPGGAGMLPDVQAQSRLHAGAITLRLREAVALEGLKVIHRHIGPAPAHWLLTHFEEVMSGLPFDGSDEAPAPRLRNLVERASPWLSAAAVAELLHRIDDHRALALATGDLFVPLHADGWAGPELEIRLRMDEAGSGGVRLHGLHASPRPGPLRLHWQHDSAALRRTWTVEPGPFTVDMPLPRLPPGAPVRLRLTALDTFVPAEVEALSTDRRVLAYQVLRVERLPMP